MPRRVVCKGGGGGGGGEEGIGTQMHVYTVCENPFFLSCEVWHNSARYLGTVRLHPIQMVHVSLLYPHLFQCLLPESNGILYTYL